MWKGLLFISIPSQLRESFYIATPILSVEYVYRFNTLQFIVKQVKRVIDGVERLLVYWYDVHYDMFSRICF